MRNFNPQKIKSLFPILSQKTKGKSLVYLDNAASTQKPKIVIDAIKDCYENFYANIHRGMYDLAEKSTEAYENCRKTVAKFINAKSKNEMVFTKNCTESINLVAYTWGEKFIKKGDEIIVSILEHHSNLVPWQELCKRKNATLKVIPITKDYQLDFNAYEKLLSKKTKLVAITAISNVLGIITPINDITKLAHKYGAKVLIDGAQSIGHTKTDIQETDCDFFTFSAHKMFGPSGVGLLYAKEEILKNMPPFLFGGDMIRDVEQYSSTYTDPPHKFEAGTPNIADVIALEKAIEFIQKIGLNKIEEHENSLLKYAVQKLSKHKEVKLFVPKNLENTSGILSFTIKNIHPHDIATIFNKENIAIRAGHHCAQPLMKALKIPATARASFYIYNTKEDINRMENTIKKTIKVFE